MAGETRNDKPYDVLIVGAGASGAALLHVLARYTDIPRLALLEKYSGPAHVNSHCKNNSQTLHVGDIETNYSIQKAQQVKPAALMVPRYAAALPRAERDTIVFPMQKMVLAVGRQEVDVLTRRFEEFRELFPEMTKLDRRGIEEVEPMVVKDRDPEQPILALFDPHGYGVDYGALARSLVAAAPQAPDTEVALHFNTKLESIAKEGETYCASTNRGTYHARSVVFDTDAYSLRYAKQLGYGKAYSLIPIAGSFYFSKELLRGKVYTVQSPKLPFAAVHGDPDVHVRGKTRWGPTARFFPVLESRKLRTSADYFRSAGLTPRALACFVTILFDPVRFAFLFRNLLYDTPGLGVRLFAQSVRKIAPGVKAADLTLARGFGGMRLQRVDTRTRELQLGEGKIIGERIIFNMTPSPGASVCLYNGMRDARTVTAFFAGRYRFDETRLRRDLLESRPPEPDPSGISTARVL